MSHLDSLHRLLPLAWPVFVGQLASLAFTTLDTVLLGRYASLELAALAVGVSIYSTIFVGLMGVVMALAPITGQLYGAKRYEEAGDSLHQALWVALGLSLLGALVLLMPGPFLALAQPSPDVEAKVRGYLSMQALTLPAALMFTAYRSFNTAVSRPKAVMVLQLTGLACKVPLSIGLIQGFSWPLIGLSVPALGATGCALATAIVMWTQLGLAILVLRHDRFYARFGLHGGGLHSPNTALIRKLLKLGLPMGSGVVIEVTGFTFMAIFIARLGADTVAAHQICANLAALMFMMPMALSNATGTLVAQAIGARRFDEAKRLGWHGLQVGLLLATAAGGLVNMLREQLLGLYTHDAGIVLAALPLLLWLWIFHVGDAVQTVGAAVLRAHHVAHAPTVIYALAIWGVGIGGGYGMAYGGWAWVPEGWRGAPGFWVAASAGLVVSGLALAAMMVWIHRIERHDGTAPAK